MACHAKARGQQHAAQIQRIPRVGVWPGSGQLLVLAKMPGGVTSQEQSNRGNGDSAKKPLRLGTRKPECRNTNRIPHADTPANPEICRLAHARAFRQECAACNTCSTVIRSMAGEKVVRRL